MGDLKVVECDCSRRRPSAERCRRPSAGPSAISVAVAGAVACTILCVLDLYHVRQCALLQSRVYALDARLEAVEATLFAPEMPSVATSRARRSVTSSAQHTSPAGIPVLERPYGHRPHQQGPKHRLMSTYDEFDSEVTSRPAADPSLLPHHRSSAAFGASRLRLGRVNTDDALQDVPPQDPAAPGTPAPLRVSGPTSDTMAHRKSRVPVGPHKKSRRRNLGRKRSGRKHIHKAGRVRLEARGAAPGYAEPPQALRQLRDQGELRERDRARHRSGTSGQQRSKRLMRLLDQLRAEMATTAAHYEGHTSNYSLQHPHYGGNGLLRNVQPDAVFADWREASWMRRHGFSRDFSLYGGQVTVKRTGVYYIYAQINYLDDSDINGFEIAVNTRPLAKCLTMEASDQRQKANTCHTSATVYLRNGESVTIRDLEPGRISMFLPDRSFFGLVRLAGTDGLERGPTPTLPHQ